MTNHKSTLTIILFLCALSLQAQSRKDVANFSLFQQYFNPALTGFEGPIVKTYYRDQWSNFQNAPRTFFISGELDLHQWKYRQASDSLKNNGAGVRHSIGISYLHDTFGPLVEGQLYLSYASRVQLTQSLGLRAGGSVTLNTQRINGDKITLDQENDPAMAEFIATNTSSSRLDFNLGLTLTGEDFYAGYALQDVANGGFVSGDDFLKGQRRPQHVIMAGYRRSVAQKVGIIANSLLRYNTNLGETIEGQLKGVFNNQVWAGLGYRHKLAYSIHAGVQLQQLRLGFVREIHTGKTTISSNTHEIVISYNFLKLIPKNNNKVTMW